MIQPVYSNLAKTVNVINNANRPWGTLIEEIPTDVGRSYAGYKRGGILEGAEKMRKELMTAVVWMAGIPAFNKLGNFVCEKILNIPTEIEYSNSKEGNAAIEDSVNYLINKANPKNLDVSDLAKYKDKFKGADAETLIKKVKYAKQTTSILAVILNCIAIGVVIPKINQALTRKKMQEQSTPKTALKVESMDDFVQEKKAKSNIAFKGAGDFAADKLDKATYMTENSNTFRLVITDVPMIIGRMLTSRNKYEALEYLVMDGGSVFFYNFCSGVVQKMLRGDKIPEINPKVAEIISQLPQDDLEAVYKNFKAGKKTAPELFSKEVSDLIYKEATYGKYGKINKFIKDDTIKGIDSSIVKTLEAIEPTANKMKISLGANNAINKENLSKAAKQTISHINKSNAGYLAAGLLTSIFGLAILMPKLTFWVTKQLTGKDQFTGIANYDDDSVKKD